MQEKEVRRIIDEFERTRAEEEKQREEFGKQIVPSILKIPIEGFVSDSDRIVLAEDLVIEKVSDATRTEFFERSASLESQDYKKENNWFFLTYNFEDERRVIGGIETGNRILLIAIFFAIFTDRRVRINKSQGFVPIEGELRSIGLTRIPNAPWYFDRDANFDATSIHELRASWPHLKKAFNQPHFALVARRYYFSLIRTSWEDQLIDLIIALEALLVPETDETNKSGKIGKRLSRLLSKKFPRGEVAAIARECYTLRNKVIHGDNNYSSDIAYPAVDLLRRYVKAALITVVFSHNSLSPKELAEQLDRKSTDR